MLIENAPPQPFNGYKLKHPRLRGEDGFESCQPRHTKETPPLTRGRRLPRRQCLPRRWKHPRLRGEDGAFSWRCKAKPETPPLTRGRHLLGRLGRGVQGNTPAYAGKTDLKSVTERLEGKHPRLRGEDRTASPILLRTPETPPLTRGRQAGVHFEPFFVGNTPAYAGKTPRTRREPKGTWKHPRLRGEDPSTSMSKP